MSFVYCNCENKMLMIDNKHCDNCGKIIREYEDYNGSQVAFSLLKSAFIPGKKEKKC